MRSSLSAAPSPLARLLALGLLHADLEVLSGQIRLGLGPNRNMVEHHRMFCTLDNVHHQIVTQGELLSTPRFWCTFPDLPYRIQNVATIFLLELEQLTRREVPCGIC
jgi:hypothetical protein